MSESNWVHIEVEEILRESNKEKGAFLVTLKDWEGKFWIPYSQVDDYENYNAGDKDVTLSITQWIAEQLGITKD